MDDPDGLRRVPALESVRALDRGAPGGGRDDRRIPSAARLGRHALSPEGAGFRAAARVPLEREALRPGLFDGEHYFRIEPLSEARLRFHQGEIFTGLLVPLFARSLDGNVRQGFDAMNEALKREAEAK